MCLIAIGLILVLGSSVPRASAQQGFAYIVAGGTGGMGYRGDGGPARNALLGYPTGVQGRDGTILIADSARIRSVGPDGIIQTFAGNGRVGHAADGSLAKEATVNPTGPIQFLENGEVLFAESWLGWGTSIRKVDAEGRLSTFAGNGSQAFAGDGKPALQTAVTASGMTMDKQGNLFVSDGIQHRVKRIDRSTTIVTTIAGDGFTNEDGYGRYAGDSGPARLASLDVPLGLDFMADGSLLIADAGNRRIRRVMPGVDGLITGQSDELITTIAGGGQGVIVQNTTCHNPTFLQPCFGALPDGDGLPATMAWLDGPDAVQVDSKGNIYITVNTELRKVDAVTGTITTVAGNPYFNVFTWTFPDYGPATLLPLWDPSDLWIDDEGNIFMTNMGWHNVVRIDAK